MNIHHSAAAVAVYKTHEQAEAAVKELQSLAFNMKNLSIVARDFQTDEHVVGYYNTGNRMRSWGATGAFWGGIWGWLAGSAFFFIPGVGPLLMGGPIVGWIVGALEVAVLVGGASTLAAALYSQGFPKNSVVEYETALKAGKFIVIAHGTSTEIIHARKVLHEVAAESSVIHEMPVQAEADQLVIG